MSQTTNKTGKARPPITTPVVQPQQATSVAEETNDATSGPQETNESAQTGEKEARNDTFVSEKEVMARLGITEVSGSALEAAAKTIEDLEMVCDLLIGAVPLIGIMGDALGTDTSRELGASVGATNRLVALVRRDYEEAKATEALR